MRLADQFLAGLQFDHADAERRTDHGRQSRAIGIQHAAVAPDRGLIMLRHPFLAHLNGLLRGLRELHIGLRFEAAAPESVELPAWVR